MGEERAPEHLVLAVADIEPEDLPAAIAGHSGGDHDRLAGDQPAATDMQVGGIQEHVRIGDLVEPSGAEPADLFIESCTDAGYLGLGDPGPAERDDEVVDVASGDPVHPGFHHHRVQGLVDPPPRLKHRREERALAELGDRQLDGACLGHQLPRSDTVSFGHRSGVRS